ncbi:MAG: hypothetical protein WKG32_17280 [Gemmatimonadaceae bacterium]
MRLKMEWLDRIRGMADRVRGMEIPKQQEWVELYGAGDTATLLRAVDAVMPRDAMLNVMEPRSAPIETFLRRHAGTGSRPASGDYFLHLDGAVLRELAMLVEQSAPEPACARLFVTRGAENLLEAYRRDAGEDVVWLSRDLAPDVVERFRAVLEQEAPPAPATPAESASEPGVGFRRSRESAA